MNRTRSARAEYHQQQRQRVEESANLAELYPRLKSLNMHLEFFSAEGVTRMKELKYKVNIDNAKSVFLFGCASGECFGGDFDLTKEIARAISVRKTAVNGELLCQGQRRKPSGEVVSCQSVLRYKLKLAYKGR